jgi:predicted Zn-dependent protease
MRPSLRPASIAILLLALLPASVACHTVPDTQRAQLNLLSIDAEVRLGREAYAEILAKERLVRSGPAYERLQRVSRRLVDAATQRYPQVAVPFEWEFALIDDPAINAWALPGGKCAANTGLLQFVQSDDELAIVIGHEIAHAVARHGGERMSQSLTAALVAEIALGRVDPLVREAVFAAYGLGVGLPFSRKHELEADRIGLFIAAAAGYDPTVAPALWRRLAMQSARAPEWLSTHPDPGNRARELEALMPTALAIRQAAAAPGSHP